MLAQSGIEYKDSHSRELLWLNCFTTTCLGGTLFARRSVRSFGEMAEPFPRVSPGVPPVAMALRLGAGPARAVPTRRSVRCFVEKAERLPRAGPGVPPVAIALRFGAGPAKAAPTRRSVRRIFPAARVAGKNDSDSFRRWRRKPGRGFPFLDLSPRDEGRESPVGCLLLLEAPAIRLAA